MRLGPAICAVWMRRERRAESLGVFQRTGLAGWTSAFLAPQANCLSGSLQNEEQKLSYLYKLSQIILKTLSESEVTRDQGRTIFVVSYFSIGRFRGYSRIIDKNVYLKIYEVILLDAYRCPLV